MSENSICIKSIRELQGMNFFIPSYQRGYRWTEQQVTDLIEDILEFSKREDNSHEYYCLQPLVVRYSQNNKWYEVIDGQQRLTTLFLILRNSKWNNKIDNLFSLSYARGTKDLSTSNADDSIEEYYMQNALKVIEKYSGSREILINTIWGRELDNQSKVRFIWYENNEDDPVEIFTRLNIGKIPLTNSELIKALFLNRKNFNGEGSTSLKLRQQEISSEWDHIENTLQNNEFWGFLHNDDYQKPTRIDFIFDLICEKDVPQIKQKINIGTDEYSTFRYFNYYFASPSENNESHINTCWGEVKKYFMMFNEWFNDLELFHYIGYLVFFEGHSIISSLSTMWYESKDKDEFIISLKRKISEKIKSCPELNFQYNEDGSNKGRCKPILLFHNIQTIINQNKNQAKKGKYQSGAYYRFPFHIFKSENWDVEHINSNTENREVDQKTQSEWLLNVYLLVNDSIRNKIEGYFKSPKDSSAKTTIFNQIKQEIYQELGWQKEKIEWRPEDKTKYGIILF